MLVVVVFVHLDEKNFFGILGFQSFSFHLKSTSTMDTSRNTRQVH